MNILVIGAGGREHALCLALKKSPRCDKLFCAPGNPGIAAVATCLPVAADDVNGLIVLCGEHKIDFVVVGPEVPLSLGLADAVRALGIPCFGPSQAAAQLESSKGFMKDICARAGVPTAAYRRFTDAAAAKAYVREQGAPIVVKADGLAAGKGVTVARTLDDAFTAIDDALVKQVFGAAGAALVIEEFMQGEEASFFALCDGTTAIPFAAAQDHKAAFDGDKGPNTGGMGAYSPAPVVDAAMEQRIMADIIHPTMQAMQAAGTPFVGVLFAGLMIDAKGPRLIEFNTRFGDPETQVMLPRLAADLVDALHAAATGRLAGVELKWSDLHALCVVMAAKGYPGAYAKGGVIGGLPRAAAIPDVTVLHAGTARNAAGDIVAQGGRVLGITATGATLKTAQAAAYRAVDALDWPEGFCRRDIGWRAVRN